MNPSMDLIAKAEKRYQELTRVIEEADRVREEWEQLQAFLGMAKRMTGLLFPGANGAEPSVTPDPQVGTFQLNGDAHTSHRGEGPTISERVEQVLKRRGPLHMKDLLREMRTSGWKGKGDDFKDSKNVANSMLNHKDRFRNRGGNVWEVIA